MALTYPEYLKVEELLALQQPKSEGPEHDELLFIVIHQAYELWFKQVLHEVDYLKVKMAEGDVTRCFHTLKRVLKILKTLVGQVDILETMTPLEFKSFRDRLDTASGFQSAQFRELEFVLGYKRPEMMKFHQGPAHERLEKRLNESSIWQDFLTLLAQNGYAIQPQWIEQSEHEDAELEQVLIALYKTDHGLAQICELLVDLDEGLQEWRYRHVKMVQRTIGTKIGTGGSSGADYLRNTLFNPVFPILWNMRASM